MKQAHGFINKDEFPEYIKAAENFLAKLEKLYAEIA